MIAVGDHQALNTELFQFKTDLKIMGAGEVAHWLRTHTDMEQACLPNALIKVEV